MANPEHLVRLHDGVEAWNQWRKKPVEIPNLSGADLSGAFLKGVDFFKANLSGADLSRADLSRADLSRADLSRADLSRANLSHADLNGAKLSGAKLNSANLNLVYLIGAKLGGAKLKNASLSRAKLSDADLSNADLSNTDLSDADLSGVKLSDADLSDADLSGVKLSDADLSGAKLNGTDLSNTDLSNRDLSGANLNGANLNGTNLNGANLNGANLSNTSLSGRDLSGRDLSNTNLSNADLSGADLSNADLSGADLSDADLSGADLRLVGALNTNFSNAKLTGACIQDWHINSSTNLQNVICDFFFFRYDDNQNQVIDRRPHDPNATFKPGEFAALVQQSLETVDLIFLDGIDWKAFFQSFQQLQSKYQDDHLNIQAIEKKPDGAFVIRLEVDFQADRAVIELDSKSFYATQLKVLEAQYEERLRLQGAHLQDARKQLEAERQERANLYGVMKTMAENQGPKYDQRGSNFGNFVDTAQPGSRIQSVQHNYASPEKQSLAEAAAEIQQLLKQLKQTNPTATEAEKKAFVTAAIPLTVRQRAVVALKSGGKQAIEEFLDNSYVNVAIAIIEGWRQADAE